MKIIKEYIDGFRWVDGNTSSAEFEKDSDQYRALIAEGCRVELIPQAEKDEYLAQQAIQSIKQELSALDVPFYKLERAISGDKIAIDDIKEIDEQKSLPRAKL